MALFGKTSERLARIRSRSTGFAGSARDSSADGLAPPPLHHMAPGSRDLRSQAVHRLQVGIFGLAAMLLLVSLASVIMQRVQTADRSAIAAEPSGSASGSAGVSPANDPLVDLGVAPEVPVDGNSAIHKPARPVTTH
jgi:hypothetical protein